MPDLAVLLVIVCVYEKTHLIKSLDIKKTLPTLISTDMSPPPRQPRTAKCNSSREIDICLFVNPPLIIG